MAIDTREKRQSIVGIQTGITSVSPTPNASKDAEWRQESGWGYAGIAADNPSPAEDGGYPIYYRRRRRD